MPSSTSFRPSLWKQLRQRLMAWMMANSSVRYGDEVLTPRKRVLFSSLYGDVLEIGPGAGPNLRLYPAGIRWVGVEPNRYMHPHLLESIRTSGRPMEQFHIDPGDPQGIRLPAADKSLDAVVSSHVLCSVPHPEESLQEILRVLKPGGRFVFVEHVAAPQGARLRTWQNLLQPLWTLVGDGCHPNRETWKTIAQAGFASVEIEHFRYPGTGPVSPHIAGSAVKAA